MAHALGQTWEQELVARGREIGKAEGKVEGKAEGRSEGRTEEARALLLRLGRKRFGEPDSASVTSLGAIIDVARLERMTTADGRPLRVLSLPMPAPLYLDRIRLPASYANFYIGNEAVLVPTFNDPNDRAAIEMLAAVFPTRRVVGIHAVDLVWGFGTLHCMTQQEPAGGS